MAILKILDPKTIDPKQSDIKNTLRDILQLNKEIIAVKFYHSIEYKLRTEGELLVEYGDEKLLRLMGSLTKDAIGEDVLILNELQYKYKKFSLYDNEERAIARVEIIYTLDAVNIEKIIEVSKEILILHFLNLGFQGLQSINTSILQEYSKWPLLQKIVNLVTEIGNYKVGYLTLLEGNRIYARTISQNLFSVTIALKLLGKSFEKLFADIDKDDTLTIRAIKENRIYIGDKFEEFVCPPAPVNAAKIGEKIVGVRRFIAIPINIEGKVIGTLNIASDRDFTENEIIQLRNYVDQIGIAISITDLLNLKQTQYDNLLIRNRELQSLYNLTSQVSKSLDPNTVAQTAVDSLPQDKNMIGGMISEYLEKEDIVKVIAATRNQISYQAEKIVGTFGQYITDLKNPEAQQNIGVRALKEGQMYYTNNLIDYLYPAMPKALIPPIEKLLNIKSVIVHPLRSRDNVIGVIAYFLREVSYENLTDSEKQLYQTYTYQIAIALDNAELYKRQKETQENLENALKQVQALRQHEQDMIDIMGHELRTPISIVRNSLSMLELEYKTKGVIDKDHMEKYLSIALESARRESKLVETLLSSAKADSKGFQLLFEQVDLIDVVDDSLEFFKREAEKKGLQVIYERPTERIDIYSDRTRIQEVIDNFLSNAVKYTEKGFIEIKIYKENGYGRVDVKDTGIGINDQDLKSLGKKFYRVDQYGEKGIITTPTTPDIIRPGGTGLGLYVTFNLIKVLDGKLNVESKLNEGSIFSFSMPEFVGQERKQVQRKIEQEEEIN